MVGSRRGELLWCSPDKLPGLVCGGTGTVMDYAVRITTLRSYESRPTRSLRCQSLYVRAHRPDAWVLRSGYPGATGGRGWDRIGDPSLSFPPYSFANGSSSARSRTPIRPKTGGKFHA